MSRALLITGPGGSGKSTLARTVADRLGWACLSEDEYWVAHGWGSGPRSPEHERIVQGPGREGSAAADRDPGGGPHRPRLGRRSHRPGRGRDRRPRRRDDRAPAARADHDRRAEDGHHLGYVQATVRADGSASVAYVLSPDVWGRGYATEAMTGLGALLERA